MHINLIDGHARLVEHVVAITLRDDIATLRLLVAAEAVGANKADRPLSHAVLDVREGVELDRDLLAGNDVTGIGSGNPGFDFQRRIGRHQRNQRLARLHDRANRDLRHGQYDGVLVGAQVNELAPKCRLAQAFAGIAEAARAQGEVLADLRLPLLFEAVALGHHLLQVAPGALGRALAPA